MKTDSPVLEAANVLDVRDRATRIRDIRAMAGRAMLDGPHVYRVAELEGPLLDLAVANARKIKAVIHKVDNAIAPFFECCVLSGCGRLQYQFMPSRHWHQAGEIIEEARISITPVGKRWSAVCGHGLGSGDTPLLAAMRAFAQDRFGPNVTL